MGGVVGRRLSLIVETALAELVGELVLQIDGLVRRLAWEGEERGTD